MSRLNDDAATFSDRVHALALGDQSVFNVAAGRAGGALVARLPCAFNFRTDFCQYDAFDCDRCAAAPRLLHAPRSANHKTSYFYAPTFGRLADFFLDVLDTFDDDDQLEDTFRRAERDFRRLLDDPTAIARVSCGAVAELALAGAVARPPW